MSIRRLKRWLLLRWLGQLRLQVRATSLPAREDLILDVMDIVYELV